MCRSSLPNSRNVTPYHLHATNRVSENLEALERFVPRSYPRQLQEIEDNAVNTIALVVGGIAVVGTIVCAAVTFYQRERRVFVFAQIEFVVLLLIGLLLVSAAAVLTALPPSNIRCFATMWLLNVGYTFELAPLVIKIAAINRYVLYSTCAKFLHEKQELTTLVNLFVGH